MSALLRLLFSVSLFGAFTACAKKETPVATSAPAAKHEHHPPHGGTSIVLGAEIYHLELVRDAATGKLSVYVLDGELEDFIRVAAPSLEIVATVGGVKQTLTLQPIANSATGEKIGDTALFEATTDWIKTTENFDGVLTALEIRGNKFTAVAFNLPKGNDKD